MRNFLLTLLVIFIAVEGGRSSACDLTNFWTETNFKIDYGVNLTQTGTALLALPIGGPEVGWTSATGSLTSGTTGWLLFNKPSGPAHNLTFAASASSVGGPCDRMDFPDDKSVWQVLPQPPPQCTAVTSRAPCGQPDDTAEECGWKGCCYSASGGANACFYPSHNAVPITSVHVIQSCHLDVGFADFAVNIINEWFHVFFPRALALGRALDARGGPERLKFMAQSYVVSLFLDCPPGFVGLVCPSPEELNNFTQAVEAGYIYWHAFPFNGELELSEPGMLTAALGLTHALDDRFKLPHKATLSQRDVPGLTRAALPLLVAQGVKALTVGVNPFSTPPYVPRAFVWRDRGSGVNVTAMWHPYFYGGIGYNDAVIIPGLPHAIVFDWRGDNAGPPLSVEEVVSDFSAIAATFPGAAVFASTLDDFTALLTPSVTSVLPVVEAEVGDTWLHGAASDPHKSAMMKRASAARAACLGSGACSAGDAAVANFTRLLLKNTEHTWGKSLNKFLGDFSNWSNAQLQAELARRAPNFMDVVASWQEQREWGLDYPLEALPQGHPLRVAVMEAWADVYPHGAPTLEGWTPVGDPAGEVEVGGWRLAFDGASGALALLVDDTGGAGGGGVWANASADGSFLGLAEYHTYDNISVAYWLEAYNSRSPNPNSFGKPNISEAGAANHTAGQQLLGLWTRAAGAAAAAAAGPPTGTTGGASFLVHAGFVPQVLHEEYGAPSDLWIQYDFPGGTTPTSRAINVSLTMLNKTATRLPEGLFLRFKPWGCSGAPLRYSVDKLGQPVDPLEVQPGGNHRQHGVGVGVTVGLASGEGGGLLVRSPDAPLAVFGAPSIFPVPTTTQPPDMGEGFSYLLINNLWNTNYPAFIPWREGDEEIRWRFALEPTPFPQTALEIQGQ